MSLRQKLTAFCVVLGVALGLRVFLALSFSTFEAGGDPLYYLHAAASLRQGEGLDYKKRHWAGTHWPPGQPAYLALFADGEELASPRSGPLGYLGAFDISRIQLVTALLSVLGVALLVELGRRCFDLRTGLLAGALLAVHPNALGISHTLYAESNFLVLLTAALVLGTGVPPAASPVRHLAIGLAFGASAWFRSLGLPMALPFAARALFGAGARGGLRRRMALLGAMAVLAGALLAVSPWTLRNWNRYHRFLLLDTSGGETMFLGNNDFPPMTMDHGLYQPRQGGRPRCRLSHPVDNFRCEVSNGLAHIVQHPGLFAERVVTRLVGLANPSSLTVAFAHLGIYGEAPGRARAVAALCAVAFTLLWLAGILGFAGAAWTPDRLAVAGTVLVALGLPATMQAETRYRLAALPAVSLFAAHFLLAFRPCLARLRQPRRLVLALAGVLWLILGWVLYARYL